MLEGLTEGLRDGVLVGIAVGFGVGGMVGVIGGLGGFTLPILFGIVSDLTNIRSSCFMLLFGLVAVCMIWMNYSIIQLNKESELLGSS